MALSQKAKYYLDTAISDKAVATEIANAFDEIAAVVAEIADPSTATAEDCANKINEIIQALQAAGMMNS